MTVGVDWLAFTLKGQRVDEVKVLVAEYLGGEFVDLEHGGKRYQRMAVGTGGAKVYWSPGRDDVHVEMPVVWIMSRGMGTAPDRSERLGSALRT